MFFTWSWTFTATGCDHFGSGARDDSPAPSLLWYIDVLPKKKIPNLELRPEDLVAGVIEQVAEIVRIARQKVPHGSAKK